MPRIASFSIDVSPKIGSISELFRKATVISNAIGVFPFMIRDKVVKVNTKKRVQCLMNIFCILAVIGIVLCYPTPSISQKGLISYTFNGSLSALVFGFLFFQFWIMTKLSNLNLFVSNIAIAQRYIRKLGFFNEIQISKHTQYLHYTFYVLLMIWEFLLNIDDYLIELKLNILHYFVIHTHFILVYQFIWFLSIIESLMEFMNEIIGDNNFKTDSLVFELMSKAYDSLSSASELLNGIYSPQLLVFISATFVLVTANAYKAIIAKNKISILLNCVCFGLAYVWINWQLVAKCAQISGKAKIFNKILYNSLIGDESKLYSGITATHVLACQHVHFSAGGFFMLDFTLLHSMAATATTYIVVLIQFNESEILGCKNVPAKPS